MSVVFKRAEDFKVSLLIALSGPAGSGKTYSALRLASGLSNGKRFAVIDTENGRAALYAKKFAFDHLDLMAPFHVEKYCEAMQAADNAGYPVIIVDSMSHAWEAEGGILDLHEKIVSGKERTLKTPELKLKSRDSHGPQTWSVVKRHHNSILQTANKLKAHVIMCFRAKEIQRDVFFDKNKKAGVHVGGGEWTPVTDSNAAYEFTMSFMMNKKDPGKYSVAKYQEQHKEIIKESPEINEKMGESFREWVDEKPIHVTKIGLVKDIVKDVEKKITENSRENSSNKQEIATSWSDFKHATKSLAEKAKSASQRDQKDVIELLADDWFKLCKKFLLSIDNDGGVEEIGIKWAKRMHEILCIGEPVRIYKDTRIDCESGMSQFRAIVEYTNGDEVEI